MFKSQLIFALLLLPFLAIAQQPVQPQLSDQEIAAIGQEIEQAIETIRQVGGLYFVMITDMPAVAKKAAIKALETASQHELCDDIIGMPEPHTVIFKSEAGKAEAQKLKAALEKIGCTVEIMDIVL